ncbi:chaperonin-like RbcX protein 2, chloroplastic isoform X2 [Mangifera indica]|uniref:chaperonin-like RbcX protein 2, chloroplastic isoform X2 n=1 Tax=Mangifera indica TaxID=29780 RepID=UPI001CFB357C|nr:chaperonin-like RbcX protein 2, chloroplastic isoform X2 [Mangifera indica]
MVVALSVVGSGVVDSHAGPCLCVEAAALRKSGGKLWLQRRKQVKRGLELGSSLVDSWEDWRVSSNVIWSRVYGKNCMKKMKQQRRDGRLVIVNEVAGQYEDGFEDVKMQILNYFTYKAVRTVMNQLYEMNPTQYSFVVSNKPGDGKRFIRTLVKEKQDLAERVMITRLHLYGKWVKKCNHAEIYKEISDENLELMRERLIETVIWPSDDTNTEKIG